MLKGPFTVKFDLQKGTGETPQFNVFEGEIPMPKIDDPTKEHYTFLGYGLKPEAEEKDFLDKYFSVGEGDVTIYAQWYQDDFLVKIDANGGAGTMDDIWVAKDPKTGLGTFVFPAVSGIARLHYAFDGWLVNDVVYEVGDSIEISKDTEISVNWKLTDCKITLISDKEEEILVWKSIEKFSPIYGKFPIPDMPETWTLVQSSLYTFVGWKDADGKRYYPGDTLYPNGAKEITLIATVPGLKKFKAGFTSSTGSHLFGTTISGDAGGAGQHYTLTRKSAKIKSYISGGAEFKMTNYSALVFAANFIDPHLIIKWKDGDEIILADDELTFPLFNTYSWKDSDGNVYVKPCFQDYKTDGGAAGAYLSGYPGPYLCDRDQAPKNIFGWATPVRSGNRITGGKILTSAIQKPPVVGTTDTATTDVPALWWAYGAPSFDPLYYYNEVPIEEVTE